MREKLKLDESTRLYKEALELVPGGVMGVRRPYNFVPREYPIFSSPREAAASRMSTATNTST